MAEETPIGPATSPGSSNNFLVRVNEYRRNNSAATISPTGHGLRINPANINYVYTAGMSTDEHEVFYVYFNNSQRLITDWSGVQTLQNYSVPTFNYD